MMPELDGYEVFNRMKADEATCAIPIIFLTASAENREMAAGLQMGASAYIRKPFDPVELFRAIARCFNSAVL